jgi:hypothetical protein
MCGCPSVILLGEENQGWTVAKYLLEFERGGQHFTIELKKQLRKLQQLVASRNANARRMIRPLPFASPRPR